MLTEGRVRAIAAQVASAIVRKFNPNISEEQIAAVQKNAESAIAAKSAAEEAAARAEEAANRLLGVAVVGVIDGDGNLILTGLLDDGTYTAYYELTNPDGTKSLVEIGELTLGEEETPDPVTYTIRWVNYDDTVLEIDEEVPEGVTPEYNGSTPTKPADSQYTYTFKGWDKTVVAATADATYTATYTQTAIGVEPAEPTNFFDVSGDGYLNPGRLSSGGANRTDSTTCIISNYIPVQKGDVVFVDGANIAPIASGTNTHYMSCYDSDQTHIASLRDNTSDDHLTFDSVTTTNAQITVTGSTVAYLRFTLGGLPSNGDGTFNTSGVVINIKRNGVWR